MQEPHRAKEQQERRGTSFIIIVIRLIAFIDNMIHLDFSVTIECLQKKTAGNKI